MVKATVSFKSCTWARVLNQRGFDEAIWIREILRGVNPLYQEKASYFDDHVGSPWASDPYGPSEMAKLDRLFKQTGDLKGFLLLEPGCGTVALRKFSLKGWRIRPRGGLGHLGENGGTRAQTREWRKKTWKFTSRRSRIFLSGKVFRSRSVPPGFSAPEDKAKALAKMERALKPGGQLIIFHFITFKEINDRHRKAGTAVENDLMPGAEEMEKLLSDAGLKIRLWEGDDRGFLHVSK